MNAEEFLENKSIDNDHIDCKECCSIGDDQYQCGNCDGTPLNGGWKISSLIEEYANDQSTRIKQLEDALEKIKAPLLENPNLATQFRSFYYDGYRSATINIIQILEQALKSK